MLLLQQEIEKILESIPDLSNFKNARQLAAYSKISGTSVKGKSKLSKIGSNRLRKDLFFPAIVGPKHNPILVNFCNKLKGKGKAKMYCILYLLY